MPRPRTAVCSIISNNYLPFARTLMDSMRDVHPEWERYVLVVDEIRGLFDADGEDFSVVEVAEIPLPQPRRFLFRYSILELNTAVKPFFLDWLFEAQGFDRVVYLDPDIRAFERLEEVERAFAAGSLACLTPHLTGPLDDRKPSELEILRAGTYNLGFIALARHRELRRFLEWWQAKTETRCVVDFAEGLFVDQKWIDLVPGMYPDVTILRHEGYNVGYWNLAHRRLTRQDGRYLVNGQPLVFFHFSGLDPARPRSFSKHQDRFTLAKLGVARELVLDYCDRVLTNGWEKCRGWSYAFGRFADGAEIIDEIRVLYRKEVAIQEAGGDDPFQLGAAFFNQPSGPFRERRPPITHLMRHVWESRADLQQHFPDIDGKDRQGFAFWFVNRIGEEHALPDVYVDAVRRSLAPSVTPSLRERLVTTAWRLAHRLRPLARRLPPRLKRRLRRLLRQKPRLPVSTIRPRVALGFGADHAGFYPMDSYDASVGSVWMGPKAFVRLVAAEKGSLRIHGTHQPDLHLAAHGSPRTTLRVSLDGEPVGQLTLARDGAFDEQLDLDRPLGDGSILSLEATRTFVPAQIGVGDDPRELSVRIQRIEVDGRPVLDFGPGPPAPRAPRERTARDIGLNIVGYVRSELGIGESARLCAGAAEAAAIPFSLIDFNVGCSSRTGDSRWAHRLSADNPHPINLIHVTPEQLPTAYTHLGPAFFEGRYNIGFWHWELPELPDEWVESFAPLQEVWVPSRFVMDAVSAKSPLPVVRMPHAVSVEVPGGITRAHFGIPEDRFLFLTMYDMHSVQQRKNPEGVIESFRRAFPQPERVGLVVKLMNAQSCPEDFARLREQLQSTSGTYLLTETISREDVYGLEACCDCFVSLHRSEGFGLGLAECMYLGKPVIGTNWSSNTDFMDAENSCPVRYSLVRLERDYGPYRAGQTWADPDLDHAAWYMRRLVEEPDFRRRIAAAGRSTIRSELSPAAIGERYRHRIRILSKNF